MKTAELALSPEGHVYLNDRSLNGESLPDDLFDKLHAKFSKASSLGLLYLGLEESSVPLPPSFYFWQTVSRQFISKLCKISQYAPSKEIADITAPQENEWLTLIHDAPCMCGIEYLNPSVLTSIWKELNTAFQNDFEQHHGSLQDYLKDRNPRWSLVGRVCFHLAENKNDSVHPFAFLATYTSQLSDHSSPQHLPLKKALQDYSGEKNHAALLALLLPIQKAATQSHFIKELVDSGEIFHPLKWTVNKAYKFLKDVSVMETSGITVRVPNWWNTQKPPRPKLSVKIGDQQKGFLGLSTLLDFDIHFALDDGTHLTKKELDALLNSTDHLVKIKEQWVEIDKDKLQTILSQWKNLEKASRNGISLTEGLRLLSGTSSGILSLDHPEEEDTWHEWSSIKAGEWLKTTLEQLKNPSLLEEKGLEDVLKRHLNASLRPYQTKGVQWLWFLYQLGLGGCLADDMGLGKTIQVLSLLLLIKNLHRQSPEKKPHLLVVPASLLGNWQAECRRFSPTLEIFTAHSSSGMTDQEAALSEAHLQGFDIVLTTYGYVQRLSRLQEIEWDLIILDEAQCIKNPGAKQTKSIKSLKSNVRLALTGTPVENRLGDLWSLFDFTSPGLLGSSKEFSKLLKNSNTKDDADRTNRFMSTLRNLTQPYILRRLKSDKNVISDLPDKTEMQTYCGLSKDQIKLYQQAIEELQYKLKETKEGIQRRGLVLSFLMRFKQICNHPTQWLGYGDYAETSSGKFLRLREICEEIAAKQEKVLVFTQFREIIPHLANFLNPIFGREGLTLDGDTSVKKRSKLVADFQEEMGPPFFILSLKAGGTGLNLTKASHVIHFDRWWNPAVENQATDRAYRIGQKQSVMVHKFICQGTIEDKIDEMITSKKNMSEEVLAGNDEMLLTELSDGELISLISLDLKRAMNE